MKKSLRKIALEKRAAINVPDAPMRLAENFLRHVKLPKNPVVAAYSPTKTELDVGFLAAALADAGHKLCLPRIGVEAQEMSFFEYAIGNELVANKFGILEPLPIAKQVQPNVVLVPMLAFDRAKHRLGYGGGYYDKFLHNLPALKIGVAFAAQEIEQVPAELHDIALDIIVTESGVFE